MKKITALHSFLQSIFHSVFEFLRSSPLLLFCYYKNNTHNTSSHFSLHQVSFHSNLNALHIKAFDPFDHLTRTHLHGSRYTPLICYLHVSSSTNTSFQSDKYFKARFSYLHTLSTVRYPPPPTRRAHSLGPLPIKSSV